MNRIRRVVHYKVPANLWIPTLGWYDPLTQYEAYYNYSVYPGNTYDYDPYNQSIKDQVYNSMYGTGNCYDQTVDCNTRGINEVSTTSCALPRYLY